MRIFGLEIDARDLDQIADAVTLPQRPRGLRLLTTLNLDHVVNLRRNAGFARAYRQAGIITVDGAPVCAYGRLRGLRDLRRVTGSDLAGAVFARLRPGHHRPALVTGSPGTAMRLRTRLLLAGFDPASVLALPAPPKLRPDGAQAARLMDAVAVHTPTHILFGIGSPKSELLADRLRQRLDGAHAMCFGAGLDYLAGTRRRAPRFMRAMGCEWSWRLMQEPRRLARRYLIDSWGFLAAIGEDARGGYVGRTQAEPAS
jgi:N-acetylglucosaminyldiphosphoundecaprenol N-acetyl-beta-D-mannosaminyltransferase